MSSDNLIHAAHGRYWQSRDVINHVELAQSEEIPKKKKERERELLVSDG